MKAWIEPLDGKYYGTIVSFDTGTREKPGVTIWFHGNFRPSKRQLKDWKMTEYQAADDQMMCDGHFESEATYQVAEAIKEALENFEFTGRAKEDK